MSECKRCTLTIVPMEEASSSEPTISKKRKTAATANSASLPCSDRSCCSSSHVKELHTAPLDLQVLGLQILTYYELCTFIVFRFALLSEFSGDSEESTMFPAKSSAEVTEKRKVKEPPKAEIEEFFAMAEKYEQKRFVEK
ncbi:hypothetical protein LR48_Vigan01g149200 [Vigna angularis]|uniref:Cyclin-dependent kinase inhibitor n=1 Tax=Phaseolus angularis TaxID=3914 RepID=A0A0L9TN91_PHAAN|nr:hypothetical protein LR48_Vigan01g149200 [Vigna angularis]